MKAFMFFSHLLRDVRSQKTRTVLTVFGIVWGTVSIVLLLGFGVGMGRQMRKDMHGMGEGIFILWPARTCISYQEGTELLIMAEMSDLIFKGTVDEIDVGTLSEGMVAELQIGAIPDQKITGRLSKISPKAKQKDNATLFDVEIEITGKGEKMIRAGYSTNASLVIRKSENVLFIPERLVEFKDDKTYVEIETAPGVYGKKEVKLGLSDGLNVEVVEGLAEGAEIVERPPKEIK